jgi:hypothetical protein
VMKRSRKIISINCKVLSNEVFCFHWVKASVEIAEKNKMR